MVKDLETNISAHAPNQMQRLTDHPDPALASHPTGFLNYVAVWLSYFLSHVLHNDGFIIVPSCPIQRGNPHGCKFSNDPMVARQIP